MKKLLVILVLIASAFAQTKINVSTQIKPPSGTAGVTQFITGLPSGVTGWNPPGVVPNAQTGASYTIAATDRAEYVSFSNAGAVSVTLPQAGSSGFASNFVFVTCDIGAGTATITPTASTISYTNGSSYTSGAANLALSTGQCAWVYSDNTNYFAIVRSGGAAGTPYQVMNVACSSNFAGTDFMSLVGATSATCIGGTENVYQQVMSGAGTISKLQVTSTVAVPAASTLVVTVRKATAGDPRGAAANTSVTCTIAVGSTICADGTHTFTYADGDLLDYQVVGTGTVGNTVVSASVKDVTN